MLIRHQQFHFPDISASLAKWCLLLTIYLSSSETCDPSCHSDLEMLSQHPCHFFTWLTLCLLDSLFFFDRVESMSDQIFSLPEKRGEAYRESKTCRSHEIRFDFLNEIKRHKRFSKIKRPSSTVAHATPCPCRSLSAPSHGSPWVLLMFCPEEGWSRWAGANDCQHLCVLHGFKQDCLTAVIPILS